MVRTLILLLLPVLLAGQKLPTVFSPDRQLALRLELAPEGIFSYALDYRGETVVQPSRLGIILSRPSLNLERFNLLRIDTAYHDSHWQPVWGEVADIRNHYREVRVQLRSADPAAVQLELIFRVFDDGLGFRYHFPAQPALRHFVVAEERTEFTLGANHQAFWIPGDYDTNEYLYQTTALTAIDALAVARAEKDIAVKAPIGRYAVQTPLLLKSASGLYLSLHEAALVNYPTMHLVLDPIRLSFLTQLTPDAVGNKAYLETPAFTPWRTLIVSDRAPAILESKLILNLNEPCALPETKWIRPQKFMGVWWEMHIGKGTWDLAAGRHAANTVNVQRYLDFAAAHGFDGLLVEGWNRGWEDWFGQWKEEVFDFVTPYPDYDLPYLTRYAQKKGLRLIMHHETSGAVTNYERRLDAAFAFMVKNGFQTVKTGYVGRIIPRGEHHDGQWMNNHYLRVARKAADYRLMVAAHEPSRPTGLHRTYPNWLANEAARGNEFNNAPTFGIPPEHHTILPFTRLMGGPMDFTPGLFHFQLNTFDSTRTTRVRSTLAKQLALYVTMYSPLQMAADLPEHYAAHLDAFQFIKEVPVDWADTRVLAAEPGDYLTIVRKDKHSERWYLGAITDEQARRSEVTLDFLTPGVTYLATLYQDAPTAHCDTNPAAYQIITLQVTQASKLPVELAPGGGLAVSFRPLGHRANPR